ncbi:elongation factor G [Aquabacter sp. CN5-332]|uniref:elongation factor G n=1 Tax=Aquabacter sp. CN5-332 TaxID=3156608 RepID=UPI0032B498A7
MEARTLSQDHSPGRSRTGPRCVAIVGPFQSGKTTLLEAILARLGTLQRQGSVAAGNSVGDACAEARAHRISVELNIAAADFLGEAYTFIDCPGSIEFLSEMQPVLPVVDAAVVVCDADDKKIPALQVILRELEAQAIPRLLFLNKIDASTRSIEEAISLLQPASGVPLLPRHMPIRRNGAAVGFVDLALERAFLYQDHAPSRAVEIPADAAAEEKEVRYAMLERLSEHDDRLMEELVEEIEPERARVFEDLAHEMCDGLAVPVLIGSALNGNGVGRLMKALRHEVPGVAGTARRLGVAAQGLPVAQVLKTLHVGQAGKLSVVRVLSGALQDGANVASSSGHGGRISGLVRLTGQASQKLSEAQAGDVVALGRLDAVNTGDTLSLGPLAKALVAPPPPRPVMAFAIRARERKDDVRLGAAIRKLVEEDPSLALANDLELGEMILRGQGELHLRVAVEKLVSRFGIEISARPPQVGYRETIRKPVTGVRGRHKKQSGGHGQFGDIVIDVAPLPRGDGFVFEDKITGGAVPRQYIPSVETGVVSSLKKGPLGFPVVDVRVTLTDGSYHSVDSSDMAFQQAARIAMAEALPRCAPVLLEPVLAISIAAPSEATAKVNAIVSSRRGQILGFNGREGWTGWDVVEALIPEAEMADLIIELRSVTAGVGTFDASFHHLAELVGREAEQVVAARQQAPT